MTWTEPSWRLGEVEIEFPRLVSPVSFDFGNEYPEWRVIMEFLLNGQKRTYSGDPELPLLTYLREVEGITSPKDGCAPQAACGCCAVDLNGTAVLGCAIRMKKVANGQVTTTEGLGEYRREVFANAFVSKGGVQ